MTSDAAPTVRVGSQPTKAMARFLIIDDHPLFRDALFSAVNNAFPNCSAVEASSLNAALEVLENEPMFDLALLDLKIPDTKGFDGLIEIRTLYPGLPVVVVSGHEDPQIIKTVISYGAAGFIPKSIKKDALSSAIQTIMDGDIFLPSDYHDPVSDSEKMDLERRQIVERFATLTRQQLRVIRMLKDGLLNKQIAFQLQVEETTAKAHVSEILRKLEVSNRTQAAIELSKLDNVEFDKLNSSFDIAG